MEGLDVGNRPPSLDSPQVEQFRGYLENLLGTPLFGGSQRRRELLRYLRWTPCATIPVF